MKTYKVIIFIFLMAFIAFGCSKKKQDISNLSAFGVEGEDKDMVMQVITSPEVLEPQPATQPTAEPIQVEAGPVETMQAIPLEAEGTQRNIQIQTALKNANLYFGEIDGKIGPLTRKAIEEFQKMKGLKVDGKVGPITWSQLQRYLNIPQPGSEKSNFGSKKKR